MIRTKSFDSTGVAPNGMLYAGDLNAIQDAAAALSDLTQNLQVASIAVGEVGLLLLHYGTGEARLSGAFRTDGILRGLGGIYPGQYTNATRNAIAAGSRPYGLIVLNTDTNQFEWNSGSDAAPAWGPVGVDPTGSLTFSGGASQIYFSGENASTNKIIRAKVLADTQERFYATAAGVLNWGPGGAAAVDTNLYRSAASVLKTDDVFDAAGLNIAGTALASTHLSDSAALARLASPAFTGDPHAPTPATADNSVSLATTAFVKAQGYAPLVSPSFTSPTANKFFIDNTIAGIPLLRLNASDAAADSKLWRQYVDGTKMYYTLSNDAQTVFPQYMVVTRAANVVSSVNFPSGTLQYAGNEVAILASPAFTGTVTVAALTASGIIKMTAPAPNFQMLENDQALDEGMWGLRASSGAFLLETRHDDGTVGTTLMSVNGRVGAGINPTNIDFVNLRLRNKGMGVHRHPFITTDRHIEAGTTTTINTGGSVSVTFSDPFGSTPTVVPGGDAGRLIPGISAVSTTGATFGVGSAQSGASAVYWIAEGAD